MSQLDHDHEPTAWGENDEKALSEGQSLTEGKKKWRLRKYISGHIKAYDIPHPSLYFLGFVFTTLLIFAFLNAMSDIDSPAYSPAWGVGNRDYVKFDGSLNASNPFKGPPGKAVDDAWKGLYEFDPIAVKTSDVEKTGRTSVEIPSRPGYHFAKLAVFHQLHCLDMVRKYVHKDHYQLDDSDSSVSTIDHIDHCIDILRQTVMCKADVTLITFDDRGPFEPPEPNFSGVHACRNFDKINEWSREHEINMTEEMAEHPEVYAKKLVKDIGRKLAQKNGPSQ